jgi:hypothetical protein
MICEKKSVRNTAMHTESMSDRQYSFGVLPTLPHSTTKAEFYYKTVEKQQGLGVQA